MMVRFQYPRTNLDFQVRNPEFGNTNTLEYNRVNKKTLGGDSIIYRDTSWPKTESITATFNLRKCDASVVLLKKLIADSVGDYITYTDFCGFEYTAYIKNPETPVTQQGIDSIVITLELELDS